MNLLDLAAIAVPAGFRKDGLPWGVALFAPAGQAPALTGLAARSESALGLPSGAPAVRRASTDALPIVVCGAHLSGLPLNGQLLEHGATLISKTQSAPRYRLFVADTATQCIATPGPCGASQARKADWYGSTNMGPQMKRRGARPRPVCSRRC